MIDPDYIQKHWLRVAESLAEASNGRITPCQLASFKTVFVLGIIEAVMGLENESPLILGGAIESLLAQASAYLNESYGTESKPINLNRKAPERLQ